MLRLLKSDKPKPKQVNQRLDVQNLIALINKVQFEPKVELSIGDILATPVSYTNVAEENLSESASISSPTPDALPYSLHSRIKRRHDVLEPQLQPAPLSPAKPEQEQEEEKPKKRTALNVRLRLFDENPTPIIPADIANETAPLPESLTEQQRPLPNKY